MDASSVYTRAGVDPDEVSPNIRAAVAELAAARCPEAALAELLARAYDQQREAAPRLEVVVAPSPQETPGEHLSASASLPSRHVVLQEVRRIAEAARRTMFGRADPPFAPIDPGDSAAIEAARGQAATWIENEEAARVDKRQSSPDAQQRYLRIMETVSELSREASAIDGAAGAFAPTAPLLRYKAPGSRWQRVALIPAGSPLLTLRDAAQRLATLTSRSEPEAVDHLLTGCPLDPPVYLLVRHEDGLSERALGYSIELPFAADISWSVFREIYAHIRSDRGRRAVSLSQTDSRRLTAIAREGGVPERPGADFWGLIAEPGEDPDAIRVWWFRLSKRWAEVATLYARKSFPESFPDRTESPETA